MNEVILETKLELISGAIEPTRRGKVRDIYEIANSLLIVATDRISAFDVVLPTGIPGKGKVLTALTLFWFDYLKDVVPNHLVTADPLFYPATIKSFKDLLTGRSMIVEKARVVTVECGARIFVGLGLERLLSERRGLRRYLACWIARIRVLTRADFYTSHQSRAGQAR